MPVFKLFILKFLIAGKKDYFCSLKIFNNEINYDQRI